MLGLCDRTGLAGAAARGVGAGDGFAAAEFWLLAAACLPAHECGFGRKGCRLVAGPGETFAGAALAGGGDGDLGGEDKGDGPLPCASYLDSDTPAAPWSTSQTSNSNQSPPMRRTSVTSIAAAASASKTRSATAGPIPVPALP